MKKIMPTFSDEKDKLIAIVMITTSIFFSFIPSLVVIFGAKKYVSESTVNVAKLLFNFELLLFLLALLFLVPIIGQILGFICAPIMMIFNAIMCLINLCSVGKGEEVKLPQPYQFL